MAAEFFSVDWLSVAISRPTKSHLPVLIPIVTRDFDIIRTRRGTKTPSIRNSPAHDKSSAAQALVLKAVAFSAQDPTTGTDILVSSTAPRSKRQQGSTEMPNIFRNFLLVAVLVVATINFKSGQMVGVNAPRWIAGRETSDFRHTVETQASLLYQTLNQPNSLFIRAPECPLYKIPINYIGHFPGPHSYYL